MSVQQVKTKKGAAAIYVVIFTATLLSIISLSFVRLMLSEMGRTGNYSLSQSAYNSALAGIEDAKIVLLRYQNCVNNDGKYSINNTAIKCGDYIEKLQTKASENAENCDLVGQLLEYNTSNHETIIQTGGSKNQITDAGATFDQAYTCVRISPKNKNYLTTLTPTYPTKIIPIRTSSETETNKVNRIVLSWFSRKNMTNTTKGADGINFNDELYHVYNKDPKMEGALTLNNKFHEIGDYKNAFDEKPIVPSTIQVTMLQTAKNFRLSQFYSADGNATNRGTITLRPTTANPYNVNVLTDYSNQLGGSSYKTNGGPFAESARKSQNTPLDVHCFTENGINTPNGYACTADVYVPRPIVDGSISANKRNYTTFFLVVNLPYGGPETEVSVELKSCTNKAEHSDIYENMSEDDDDGCTSVDFADVQPIVDSTGRANDLFRRIEARVELVDTYFPIVNYALAVDKTKDGEGDVEKDFYVTTNCKYEEWVWKDGSVQREADNNCSNSGKRN